MKRLLGDYLRQLRGDESRLRFAARVGLSYTFIRELELGNRLPSDEVLIKLAQCTPADQRRLFLYTYSDRSPLLRKVLEENNVAELWSTE